MISRARKRRRPPGSGPEDARAATDDVLDGHAAYREELERVNAAGDCVPDVGPDPLAADPARFAAGAFGFREDDTRYLSAGLEMLRREHGED